MAKTRPCKHAKTIGCPYPAAKSRQTCIWHWLENQPARIQEAYAQQRRENSLKVIEKLRFRVPESEWPNGERFCSLCQGFVPLFYCSGSRCKAHASKASHASAVKSKYGLEDGEYDALMARQGGRCAICLGRPQGKRFAVDHHHQTLENRGILCSRCNHELLGAAHDDPKMLWRALAYLLMPPAQFSASKRNRDALLARLAEVLTPVTVLRTPPSLGDDERPPF